MIFELLTCNRYYILFNNILWWKNNTSLQHNNFQLRNEYELCKKKLFYWKCICSQLQFTYLLTKYLTEHILQFSTWIAPVIKSFFCPKSSICFKHKFWYFPTINFYMVFKQIYWNYAQLNHHNYTRLIFFSAVQANFMGTDDTDYFGACIIINNA